MGFGLPASIGAQLAEKDATVVAVLGDGGFQMTFQELATIVDEKLTVNLLLSFLIIAFDFCPLYLI